MIFKHERFTLDPEKQKVRDENGKELHLVGKPYKMLAYLCAHGASPANDINDEIDPNELTSDNSFRQYRNKIKTAIGYEVIKYDNQTYSIIGEVKMVEGEEKPPTVTLEPKVIETKKLILPRQNMLFATVILVVVAAIAGWVLLQNQPAVTAIKNLQKPINDMVKIPAGEFIMGSTEAQALAAFKMCEEGNNCYQSDYYAEYPQRKINLPDFQIDRKAVSNADYSLFIQATKHRSSAFASNTNLNGDNQPVVGVSWDDATAYCAWAGKRLPTENEWEKAARGTDGRIWPWGNEWNTTKANHGQGGEPGYDESDGYKFTAPVGTELGVSPFGVLNIAGNVYEWVSDEYGSYTGNDKYTSTYFSQHLKVLRGGSYVTGQSDLRTANRYYMTATTTENDIGFRCAK